MLEYKLPELGEDIETADVINVYVKNGDNIEKDEPILELETDKAALDLPSPASGTIKEIMVKEGDTIKVGQVVVKIDDSGESAENEEVTETEKKEDKEPDPEQKKDARDKREGKSKDEGGSKATREEKAVEQEVQRDTEDKKAEESREAPTGRDEEPEEDDIAPPEDKKLVPASPSIRKLARELGININNVTGSGPSGRITDKDVKDYARRMIESRDVPQQQEDKGKEQLPDFSKWGDIERMPMSTVRKLTSDNLTKAWRIPHVTQYDKADITELDKLRKQYKDKAASAGGNLTITPIIIKVVASALKVFPKFNSTIDVDNNEIIYKKYINIGFAVDTERGLLVPNVRNTDKKNIIDISVELADMSERARSKKLKPEEMQGGTFSVSNLGGIGGTYFTPIIYFPEVAILGVSKAYTEPVFENGELKSRLMMPLSLSYDHRLIDGAEGIRFLRWVVEALEEPFKIIFEGEF